MVAISLRESRRLAGRALEVAVADRKVLLDAGIRMDRQGEAYRLSTHGPAFTLEAGGTSIAADGPVAFKVTEKGFDFGKQGVLEGSALTAKVAAKVVAQDPPPAGQDPPLPPNRRSRAQGTRPDNLMRRVFGNGNPLVSGEAADGQAIRMIEHVTPTGSP